MKNRASILFIVPNFQIRGSHIPMIRIANTLTNSKISENVIYNIHPIKTKNNDLYSFLDKEVKVYNNIGEIITSLSIFKSIPLKFKLKIELILTKIQMSYIIRKHKINIVNSHAFLADLFVENLFFKYYKNKNIKYTSTWHGCYESTYIVSKEKKSFKMQITKRFNKFDAIIYVSEKQKIYIDEIFEIKNPILKKIYYGIDSPKVISKTDIKLDFFDKIQYDFVFGMISAKFKEKGWEQLIQAFLQLKEEHLEKKIALILVGGEEYFDELDKKYNDKNVFYIKNTNNPIYYINLFDVGVLPTYYLAENLPNVIIEYLRQNKPIISTDWVEIPNMIKDKEISAGLIVPLVKGKPSVNDLKISLQTYLSNQILFEEHKINTKIILNKKFNIKKIVNQYIQLFQALNNDKKYN